MKQPDSMISALSEFTTTSFDKDLRNIKILKMQALILALIAAGLLYLCFVVKFADPSNYHLILKWILSLGSTEPTTLFLTFFVASCGNAFAAHLIYSEAKEEEKTVKKLMKFYYENAPREG